MKYFGGKLIILYNEWYKIDGLEVLIVWVYNVLKTLMEYWSHALLPSKWVKWWYY